MPTTAHGQPKPSEKNWLFATHTVEKSEKFVGVMINEPTCLVIAQALNDWAKVPPVTPLVFACKQEPERA